MKTIRLECRNVTKRFAAQRKGEAPIVAVQNLNFKIADGEVVSLIGPSGCGKSTLLAVLSGLQKIDSGRVLALGSELGQLDLRALERFRLQHTGFVFQGFNLFPALSAFEQVELPLNHMGMTRDEAHARARRSLEEVGLAHRMKLRPSELSGGEKQRVAIARALAKEPELLFADEPTSALDAANGQMIIDILHRIAHTHGTTVLCVSHDPRLVIHADRVLAMEDGRILSDRRNHAPIIDSKEIPS